MPQTHGIGQTGMQQRADMPHRLSTQRPALRMLLGDRAARVLQPVNRLLDLAGSQIRNRRGADVFEAVGAEFPVSLKRLGRATPHRMFLDHSRGFPTSCQPSLGHFLWVLPPTGLGPSLGDRQEEGYR